MPNILAALGHGVYLAVSTVWQCGNVAVWQCGHPRIWPKLSADLVITSSQDTESHSLATFLVQNTNHSVLVGMCMWWGKILKNI